MLRGVELEARAGRPREEILSPAAVADIVGRADGDWTCSSRKNRLGEADSQALRGRSARISGSWLFSEVPEGPLLKKHDRRQRVDSAVERPLSATDPYSRSRPDSCPTARLSEDLAPPLLNRSRFTLALESPQHQQPVPDGRQDGLIEFRQ